MNGQKTRPLSIRTLMIAAVVLLSIAIYLPTVNYAFVSDDNAQITRNVRVHSWKLLPEFFTAPVWKDTGFHNSAIPAPYYRPLFLVWLTAIYTLFGGNVAAWHLSTILLFAVSTWLVYLLAHELTGHWIIAVIAALIFAVHPIHLESVAWVSGVTDPVLAMPFLGTLICHMRWRRSGDRRLRIAAAVLCGLALLSKEPAVVLCVVLLVYDYLFSTGGRLQRWRRAALDAWPYFAITALYILARFAVLAKHPPSEVRWRMILLTSPSVLWTYLRHLVVPWPLSFIYNNTYIERFGRDVFIPAFLLLAIAAALFWWGRHSRLVLFSCAWILLMLLPVLNLGALVQGEVVHDRYLYLPSVAFSMVAAVGLYRLARLVSSPRRLRVLAGTSAAVAVIFGLLTVVQGQAWSDEIALFTRACKVAPRNAHATQELAYALARSGNCQEAYPLLAELAELNPWVTQTPFFQGSCYLQEGRLGAAEPFFLRALELDSGYQPALLDLAWIYAHTGRIDEAERVWNTAAERTPHPEVALFAIRADILRARGDWAGAEEQIRRALALQPDDPGFRAQLKELEAKRPQERSAITPPPLEHRPSE